MKSKLLQFVFIKGVALGFIAFMFPGMASADYRATLGGGVNFSVSYSWCSEWDLATGTCATTSTAYGASSSFAGSMPFSWCSEWDIATGHCATTSTAYGTSSSFAGSVSYSWCSEWDLATGQCASTATVYLAKSPGVYFETYSCPPGVTRSGIMCLQMSECGAAYNTCTIGDPTVVNANEWVCDGIGASDMVACSLLTPGVCGSSSEQYSPSGGPFASLTGVSPNLCDTGTVVNFTESAGSWNWFCLGSAGNSPSCSAQKTCTPTYSFNCSNPEPDCTGRAGETLTGLVACIKTDTACGGGSSVVTPSTLCGATCTAKTKICPTASTGVGVNEWKEVNP